MLIRSSAIALTLCVASAGLTASPGWAQSPVEQTIRRLGIDPNPPPPARPDPYYGYSPPPRGYGPAYNQGGVQFWDTDPGARQPPRQPPQGYIPPRPSTPPPQTYKCDPVFMGACDPNPPRGGFAFGELPPSGIPGDRGRGELGPIKRPYP